MKSKFENSAKKAKNWAFNHQPATTQDDLLEIYTSVQDALDTANDGAAAGNVTKRRAGKHSIQKKIDALLKKIEEENDVCMKNGTLDSSVKAKCDATLLEIQGILSAGCEITVEEKDAKGKKVTSIIPDAQFRDWPTKVSEKVNKKIDALEADIRSDAPRLGRTKTNNTDRELGILDHSWNAVKGTGGAAKKGATGAALGLAIYTAANVATGGWAGTIMTVSALAQVAWAAKKAVADGEYKKAFFHASSAIVTGVVAPNLFGGDTGINYAPGLNTSGFKPLP